MNICFFNRAEDPGRATRGGVGRSTHLLAEELRRRGHCVDFYHSEPPSRHSHNSSKRVESARFREFLIEHKTDIAVRQGMHRDSHLLLKNLPCRLVMVLRGTPAVSSAKSYAEHFIKKRKIRSRLGQSIIRSKLFSFLGWKLHDSRTFSRDVRRCDKYVLLSKRFFREFPPMQFFPEKICAIPNIAPFSPEQIDFSTKKKELLWVGRISFSDKRPDLMLYIWKLLQDRFSDWKLRFLGKGAYLPDLEKLSLSLGLKNVSFEGHQDPVPYYRAASILCLTSPQEGFPMVLVESQAFGCIPVSFDSFSSVHDIIEDGETGALVPGSDIEKYAEKLSELMLKPVLREHIALNGQKSIARFSPEKIGDEWEKLFHEINKKDKNFVP